MISHVIRQEIACAQIVAQSLRQDAALLKQQHPTFQTVHAQMVRAANVIERLVGLLQPTIA